MLYSSAQIGKLIKKIQEEIQALKSNENKIYTYTYANGEDIDEIKYDYDFVTYQNMISSKESDIRILKHALNIFNSTTTVEEFGMTVDQMLIALPQLNERLSKYKSMKDRLPKERLGSSGGYLSKNSNGAIEYRCINYDQVVVASNYTSLLDYISRMQIALDEINSRVCIDIPVAGEEEAVQESTQE